MSTSAIIHRQARSVTHHIAEDKAGMGEFEVFEEAVEFAAVQGAPGTVKIISRLRLLPGVVVVQELNKNQSHHHKVKHEGGVRNYCHIVVQKH